MHELQDVEAYWSKQAARFDEEPDHGLIHPAVRMAWAAQFAAWIPAEAVNIVDLGCGTGSLSILLAANGFHVTGIDLSPAMVTADEQYAIVARDHV